MSSVPPPPPPPPPPGDSPWGSGLPVPQQHWPTVPSDTPAPNPWVAAVGPPPPGHGAPGAAPPRSDRPTWLIPSAIIAVVIFVIVAIVINSRSDSGDGGLSTSAAATQLQALADRFDLSAGESQSLDGCDAFDLVALAQLAPKGYDAKSLANSTVSAVVVQAGSSRDPLIAECLAIAPDGSGLFGMLAGRAPTGDVPAYLDRVNSGGTVQLDDPVAFDGGTLYAYRLEIPTAAPSAAVPNPTATPDSYDALWVHGDIQIGLFVEGVDADETVADAWIRAALPAMVDGLAALQPDQIEPLAS